MLWIYSISENAPVWPCVFIESVEMDTASDVSEIRLDSRLHHRIPLLYQNPPKYTQVLQMQQIYSSSDTF